jgi:competence protein ComEA
LAGPQGAPVDFTGASALAEPPLRSGSPALSGLSGFAEPAGLSGLSGFAEPAGVSGLAEAAGRSERTRLSESARRLPVLSGSSPFDPGRRGIKALAAVAALVVLAAGFLAWRSRPQAEPVTPTSAAAVPGGLADAPAPDGSVDPAGPAQATSPGSGGAEVVVAVAGKVRRPGLVRLPPGARVADAIEAAGGVLPGTDMATVNLARKVTDGELIVVGVPGAVAAAGGAPTGPAAAGPAAPGEKVNLNTATLAQLDTLPGVGPVLAQRILDYRTSHGGFRSVNDLRQVDGIGDSRFEELKDLVTV